MSLFEVHALEVQAERAAARLWRQLYRPGMNAAQMYAAVRAAQEAGGGSARA